MARRIYTDNDDETYIHEYRNNSTGFNPWLLAIPVLLLLGGFWLVSGNLNNTNDTNLPAPSGQGTQGGGFQPGIGGGPIDSASPGSSFSNPSPSPSPSPSPVPSLIESPSPSLSPFD